MITGKVKETELQGLSTVPNDYSCGDGWLQVCHNMVNTGGGLRPVEDTTVIDSMHTAGYELVYIHHTATGDVYVYVKGGTLYYNKIGGSLFASLGVSWKEHYQITNVGNILILTDGDATLNYMLWQGSSYKVLGSKIPELKIEFTLQMSRKDKEDKIATVIKENAFDSIPTIDKAVETRKVEYGTIDMDEDGNLAPFSSTDNDWWSALTASADRKATEQLKEDVAATFNSVMGTVNKMVSEAKDDNCFTHSFFVRYAYELYDGTMYMQSVPILMVPSTTVNPVIFCREVRDRWTFEGGYIDGGLPRYIIYTAQLLCGKLRMRVRNSSALSDWKDIIQRVNIYVTPQLLPYDPEGRKMTIENGFRIGDGCYSIGYKDTATPSAADKIATKDIISLSATGYDSATTNKVGYIYLPELTATTYEKKVEEAYLFYLLRQYTLDELDAMSSTSWQDVDIVKGALKTIEAGEPLKDDYHTHDIITAKVLNTYNNRLNKANCKLTPFTDMPGEWLSCYTSDSTGATGVYTYSADIYIKENGVKVRVGTTSVDRKLLSGYFFYPNPNAYLMVLKKVGSGTTYCSVKLKRHPYLYGAFAYLESFLTGSHGNFKYWKSSAEGDTATNATAFNYPNYIYTSEVDNPFVFPSEGLNAVGKGTITTIKTATKAMSQGSAFGTNPLYVFCTDGIWALEVGNTGLFVAKQAVSRETILNNDPLAATQADNSVLFLSERGLMELVGGQTKLLSGALQESHHTFDVSSLPKWTDILEKFDSGQKYYLEADDFIEYLSGARIAFDYVNYRIIVFKPADSDDDGHNTSYVYDIGAGMWGTMDNNYKSVVEDGGKTYVNKYGRYGSIYPSKFVQGGASIANSGKGFYVTRPMKMDALDTLKTVRMLLERGMTQTSRYLAMWGSRDMRNWRLIGAVKGCKLPRISGTPYKYFIVGGWAQLSVNGDNISRLTMDVVGKYGDKLR